LSSGSGFGFFAMFLSHWMRLRIERSFHKSAACQKKARLPGLFFQSTLLIKRPDVRGLIAFGSGRDVEGNLLVFLQAFEAVALDRREMREEILAAVIGSDETEAFGVVEPFNGTVTHVCFFLKKLKMGLRPIARTSRGK
jgi:hypothetical protein